MNVLEFYGDDNDDINNLNYKTTYEQLNDINDINEENIKIKINDTFTSNNEVNTDEILTAFEKKCLLMFPSYPHPPTNLTPKHSFVEYKKMSNQDLVLICNYYKIPDISKQKKANLIDLILNFEENHENIISVLNRKKLWYYMNYLKNDVFMKKFIVLPF